MIVLMVAAAVTVAGPAAASESSSGLEPVAAERVASRDYVPYLEYLATHQTEDEIDEVMASGGPVELLVDSANGEVLAAFDPGTVMTPFALSPVGPGCTSMSLCMTTSSSIPYGYTGTGTTSGTWGSIKQVKTGDRSGAFTWNGIRNAYGANTTANLTTPVTVSKIERW